MKITRTEFALTPEQCNLTWVEELFCNSDVFTDEKIKWSAVDILYVQSREPHEIFEVVYVNDGRDFEIDSRDLVNALILKIKFLCKAIKDLQEKTNE